MVTHKFFLGTQTFKKGFVESLEHTRNHWNALIFCISLLQKTLCDLTALINSLKLLSCLYISSTSFGYTESRLHFITENNSAICASVTMG